MADSGWITVKPRTKAGLHPFRLERHGNEITGPGKPVRIEGKFIDASDLVLTGTGVVLKAKRSNTKKTWTLPDDVLDALVKVHLLGLEEYTFELPISPLTSAEIFVRGTGMTGPVVMGDVKLQDDREVFDLVWIKLNNNGIGWKGQVCANLQGLTEEDLQDKYCIVDKDKKVVFADVATLSEVRWSEDGTLLQMMELDDVRDVVSLYRESGMTLEEFSKTEECCVGYHMLRRVAAM